MWACRFAGVSQAVVVVPPTNRFNRFMYRLWARSPRWTAPLLALVCFGVGGAYTRRSHPTRVRAVDSPDSLGQLTTGLDRPGCAGDPPVSSLLDRNPASAPLA